MDGNIAPERSPHSLTLPVTRPASSRRPVDPLHPCLQLFIDLVKAFDRVPRNSEKKPDKEKEKAAEAASNEEIGMLWRVLLKYGVPVGETPLS